MQIDSSEVIDINFVKPVHNSFGEKSSKDVTNGQAEQSSKSSNAFATGPHESQDTAFLLSAIHKVAPNSCIFTIAPFPSATAEGPKNLVNR